MSSQMSIAIIGLGYVGLPLSQLFLKGGHTVHGIDVNEAKVNSISEGNSNNPDVDDLYLTQRLEDKYFILHNTGKGVENADAIIICVPTPLTSDGNPDLTFVNQAVDSILGYVKPNQLICLESTTYPGTTEEVILPKVKEKGFQVGKEIFIAYSPERINPGSEVPANEIPKVVGGITSICLEKAIELYDSVFDVVYPVSSTRAAEMTKLLENTQRFINISFMNDFAILCEKMNLDVFEIIDAASTKPYGFTRYTPGPGIGGHCIPIDPLYLSWKAKEYKHETPFIKLSDDINKAIVDHVVKKIKAYLASEEEQQELPSVLIVGVAYKKDIGDVRESSVLTIMKRLEKEGVTVEYYDPHVPSVTIDSKTYQSADEDSIQQTHYDLAVVLTEHSHVDYEKIFAYIPTVLGAKDLFLPMALTSREGENKDE